jgi:hypothetical protein
MISHSLARSSPARVEGDHHHTYEHKIALALEIQQVAKPKIKRKKDEEPNSTHPNKQNLPLPAV